ncbi:hypothetical protein BN2475_710037 [Paraburkholderia ribeironis]|uniref:Uncharacterized protein n=1 Tax=Paraburkholderia ribeironis TaxID=1247936 RepID=A0A1N7SI28_9BURK|nr:hypothetical protein BN2475_710037 [Paraburkholderia ribeironis]
MRVVRHAYVSFASGAWLTVVIGTDREKFSDCARFSSRARASTQQCVNPAMSSDSYEAYLRLQKRQHRFTWTVMRLLESTAIKV